MEDQKKNIFTEELKCVWCGKMVTACKKCKSAISDCDCYNLNYTLMQADRNEKETNRDMFEIVAENKDASGFMDIIFENINKSVFKIQRDFEIFHIGSFDADNLENQQNKDFIKLMKDTAELEKQTKVNINQIETFLKK